MKDKIEIGAKIAEVRKLRKVSYYQIAKATGINQSIVKDVEQGNTSYTVDTLLKICSHLQISILFLYDV